jgi:hypothetical protein
MNVKELKELLLQYDDDVGVEMYLPSTDYWNPSEEKNVAKVEYENLDTYYKRIVFYPS